MVPTKCVDSFEPIEAEKVDRVVSIVLDGEIREHFADDGCELVSVTGKSGFEHDLWMVRMLVDDEVIVRGVGEHIGRKPHRGAGPIRKIVLGKFPEEALVFRFAVHHVGINVLPAVSAAAKLEPRHLDDRQAREPALLDLEVPDDQQVVA